MAHLKFKLKQCSRGTEDASCVLRNGDPVLPNLIVSGKAINRFGWKEGFGDPFPMLIGTRLSLPHGELKTPHHDTANY